jgi:hypothetical protein
MHNERRQHPRIHEEDGIAVKLMNEGDPADPSGTFLRLTQDVSRGGLRFSNAEEIPVNSLLRIYLVLDMPRKIVTHVGRVRWNARDGSDEPYHVGVEFTQTAAPDMQVWAHYLETRQPATA